MAEEGETPEALLKRPDLPDHLAFTWAAFMDLRSDRQMGFGAAGRIMFTSIHQYAERYGVVCPDEFDAFASLIRALDAAYLKHKPAPEPSAGKKPE